MTQIQLVFDGESLITPQAITTELSPPKADRHDEQLATGRAELAIVLTIAQQQIDQSQDPAAVTHQLIGALHAMRAKFHSSVWQALIPMVQNHSVSDFFHHDPFTRWSFEKPRGYSGDAQLIDFIYGHPSVSEEIAKASPLGRALYDYTKNAPSSVAVRERRDLLTRYVDEIAAERGPETEILTIAAGHLREADRSTALKERRIRRWVALDQDPLSVGSIARDFNGTCVEAIDGSVRGLLTKAHNLGQFDFIYAAGLYDYLTDKVAVKLTQRCLQMLKPNGVFLFANFADDISDDGYMETFMNWALLLRSEADMWRIINGSVDRNMVDTRLEFGANRNIVYGILQKRS
ncbi:class I SAM-dependent methyltransferase [Sinorhizobium numidicum]|uniref:Class I SAM-dependent methyltransferase n=1 Tax=Sinorhizobium numidicum TaxID=680248 RepID=A0ABY8CSH7_9HYPH|nr:class I SAM-dependent methyltransferase [Sinorhizobium numidicum]WEX75133.1 class I SAM-dependent methyltransferase [Sinorhizobium numidicum]WEX81127.1 class I SAM-dependent methyltransferase [Sinorhizobium numidicum]